MMAPLLDRIDKINQRLYDLSKTQLEESRRQVFISNKAKDTIEFTQGEIILLILMSILIQVIIFYKPKEWKEN
ncbi:hypothetical protein GCM10028791_38860 [Echinicola sediminis]